MRYDIISDTHGFLEPDLLDQLQGADVIVHAGDICSGADYRTLQTIAPVQMCLLKCDVAICGHTHRPFVERDEWTGTLVMNPGSPTYPRGSKPSMGRILCEDGRVVDAQIIEL